MRRSRVVAALLLAFLAISASPPGAQGGAVRIGVLLPLSGDQGPTPSRMAKARPPRNPAAALP